MTAYGQIRDGKVELDSDSALPEGVRVRIVVLNAVPQREAPRRSIAAMFGDLTADVPSEEWDNFPSDGALNHDHYLYGTPKRSAE